MKNNESLTDPIVASAREARDRAVDALVRCVMSSFDREWFEMSGGL